MYKNDYTKVQKLPKLISSRKSGHMMIYVHVKPTFEQVWPYPFEIILKLIGCVHMMAKSTGIGSKSYDSTHV